MSRINVPTRQSFRILMLTCLLLTIGNANAKAEWQETIHAEGKFRVMLPGAGKCSTETGDVTLPLKRAGEPIDDSIRFGKAIIHRCDYDRAGVSITVASSHAPPEYLAKYSEQKRYEMTANDSILRRTAAFPKNVTRECIRERSKLLGREAQMLRSTVRLGTEWNVLCTVLVFVDGVQYAVDIVQWGDNSPPALSEKEMQRIFSSFTLLDEAGASNDRSNDAAGTPIKRVPKEKSAEQIEQVVEKDDKDYEIKYMGRITSPREKDASACRLQYTLTFTEQSELQKKYSRTGHRTLLRHCWKDR